MIIKKLLAGLSILIAIVIIIIAPSVFMGYLMVDNDIKEIILSPDGKYNAVSFIRNGGATTDFSPQVSIIKANKKRYKGSGNIFRGYRSEFIDIEWEDSNTLIVYHNCFPKDIFLQEKEFNGIKIKYVLKY